MKFEYCAVFHDFNNNADRITLRPTSWDVNDQDLQSKGSINFLGEQGWELVSSIPVAGTSTRAYLLFKREII